MADNISFGDDYMAMFDEEANTYHGVDGVIYDYETLIMMNYVNNDSMGWDREISRSGRECENYEVSTKTVRSNKMAMYRDKTEIMDSSDWKQPLQYEEDEDEHFLSISGND
jgi:hypothetical protein